jgi:hypothetical protein
MEVIWLWYAMVYDMGLIRIWYKSIHIPYDLLWEMHGFLIPFHNNFAMGMIGFYMEWSGNMIWNSYGSRCINYGNGMGSTIIILYWEWYGHLFSSHTKLMLTSNIQMVDVNTCGFGMG